MKKILLVVLVVAIALIGINATEVMAAAHGTNCVTCHTPHNASTSATLWRASATGSGVISNIRGGGTASANSILCMSCHASILRGPGMNGGSLAQDHPLTTATTATGVAGVPIGTAAQCNSCHNVHNGVANYIAFVSCASCHSATGANW